MTETINKHLGFYGRMISGSKSSYRKYYPENVVMFNGNIVIDKEKVWYGDIDLTKDVNTLMNIATELNKDLYILHEMDARFENEEKPLIKDAVCVIHPRQSGNIPEIGEKYKKYYYCTNVGDGIVILIREEYIRR